MPSYHEVRLYLNGLWLLIKNDPQGFRLLDISNRGLDRSFWAILWCLPPSIASWFWLRELVLQGMPRDARLGMSFFMRAAMVDMMNWFLPLILIGLLCLAIGFQKKFPAIVIAINWLSVPFSWVYGALCVLLLVAPAIAPLVGIAQLILLMMLVIMSSRILRMINGPQPLAIAAFVLVLMVPNMLLAEALQRFLGIYPF